MRIGTWGLAGRWSSEHAEVLADLDCDVWLLSQVRPRVTAEGYHQHLSAGLMGGTNHWAGILARLPIVPEPDPHPMSACGTIAGRLFCSSVLPWPFMSDGALFTATAHPERIVETLGALRAALVGREPVWGGDWNQPLGGNIVGFSRSAQEALLATVDALGLAVPTAALSGRSSLQRSIDHIALPLGWEVLAAGVVPVSDELSDHDPYWVDAVADEVLTPGSAVDR